MVFDSRAPSAKLESMKRQSLADVLRRRRCELDLRQADVARACDLTAVAVCLIENGQRMPDFDRLPRFAEVLGLDLADLYDRALLERAPVLYRALNGA